jgi:hypothetical protein
MKRLTKEDILEGTNRRENLEVKQYGREVIVRPLSDEEITHILAKISTVPAATPTATETVAVGEQGRAEGAPTGPPGSNGSAMDLQKNFEALRMAVSMGMVEPRLTYEEVSKMKFGVPEFIGTYILQISGVTSADQVKKKGRR